MPFVPDQVSITTVTFAAMLAIWVPIAIAVRLRGPKPPSQRAWFGLVAFFASVALSLPISLANHVPLGEWARGAVPFVFLAAYALFPALTEDDRRFLFHCILAA